ncbi:MAG: MBL fold metallo-hydrolase [Bacteroidia bacterium]|nr:MBL fold metallo-hydrolase [Bacteroidia bacterium]
MIHTLDLRFQTDSAIAAFLIETREGPMLVECGPHSTFERLRSELARYGYRPEDIRKVLLSHIHFDHAGAAWAFAQAGAIVYVHPAGWKHLQDPARLYQSAKRIYGDLMETLWGEMHSIPEAQLIAVEDGAAVELGEYTFTAWHTPGHAVHHIAWETEAGIFTGDVGGVKILGGPVVPPCPPPDIDLEAWQASIARLRALAPARLYLTHYGAVDDVAAHLDALESRLLDWGAWMKIRFEAGRTVQDVTPEFQAYAADQLRDAGIPDEIVRKYEAANPAFMSVAGLLRYWEKRSAL